MTTVVYILYIPYVLHKERKIIVLYLNETSVFNGIVVIFFVIYLDFVKYILAQHLKSYTQKSKKVHL